jgi:hypothetical protein
LRSGGLWFGDLHSSHPTTTLTGWYWAISHEGDLFASARGSVLDGETLMRDRRDVLAWLIGELVRRKVILRPNSLQIAG